jgi:hypothetical protein
VFSSVKVCLPVDYLKLTNIHDTVKLYILQCAKTLDHC